MPFFYLVQMVLIVSVEGENKPETAVEISEMKHEEKIAEPEVQEALKDEAVDQVVSEERVGTV